MTLLAALVLAPSIDGERAIFLAKKALADFDVPAPLSLTALWRATAPQTGWKVEVHSPGGLFDVALDEAGRARSIQPDPFGGPTPVPPSDPGAAARAARWLERFVPLYPTRRLQEYRPRTHAFFNALVEGYPVVYPRTRLGYSIVLRDRAFRSFRAYEEPIAVGPKAPRLAEKDALASAQRIFAVEEKAYAAAAASGASLSHRLEGTRDLGWVIPEDEKVARLAWRIPHWENHHHARGVRGSLLALFVDARTGEAIPTKYRG